MGGVRNQSWSWIWCFFLSWMAMAWEETGPSYLVGIPAILESGAETNFCASLLHPNETLTMTVFLNSEEENITLFKETSSKDFHKCHKFKVPVSKDNEVWQMVVEVQGATFSSREVRKVLIRVYRPITFIQTDKPIYLPGQTVHFRVVSLDTKFRPAVQMYDIIEIQNPSNTRIGQWLNKTSSLAILQLSYSLNSEARQGVYQLSASVDGDKIYHNFKVEKYVLPKFDIKINGPDEVVILEDDIAIEVCSKYTFGQPVPGSATLKVCRPIFSYLYNAEEGPLVIPPCYEDTKQTNKMGCATFIPKLSTFTKIDQKAVQDVLEVHAEVKEEGTGITQLHYKRIQISYVIGKLSFEDTPKICEDESLVEGKVKAVDYNNTAIAGMDLYVLEGVRWSAQLRQNLTTDLDGFATFSISTVGHQEDIHLYVSATPTLEYNYRTPYYENGQHTISPVRKPSLETKTASYLLVKNKDKSIPCDKDEDVTIQYTVVGESQGSVDLIYLVLARGAIVLQGAKQITVADKSVNEGEVTFQLKVSAEMAPEVQIVAYAVLPSATVIAHSAHYTTEKCFGNKISLEFGPDSAVPGEKTTLKLTTQPYSLCGVSIIDQSVLIQEPGKTLNADKIFGLLPVTKSTYIPYKVEDQVECLQVRPKRSILPFPGRDIDDPYTVFQNNGLKMATNLNVRVPVCLNYKGREYHNRPYGIPLSYETVHSMAAPPPAATLVAGGLGGLAPIQTVRNFFPETWLWDLVEVGNSGMKDVPLTAPDTITTWETETLCLSPLGFGLAPRQKLTVFQPFFLELTLPYSIKRGEHFELKATVFNFLSKCIMVSVTPTPSEDYVLTPLSGDEYNACLCGNERKTVRWTLAPSTLGVVNVTVTAEAVPSHASCDNEIVSVPERGRIDTVTRPLIVKAEGTEVTQTHNLLLCPKGNSLKEEIELKLPENAIEGSARGLISVLGDILGRALENLDGLLRMPHGCGEQNMALLAPNIYIAQYLKDTQQLTPAIEQKIVNFLTNGYQRQLNYQHSSGGYSTFGTGVENTWLTAFVMRSFAKAKSFIYIDPANIEDSEAWLQSKQEQNGCFQMSGKLFHNRMKGGVSDEVTLSAYITAAFLEMGKSVNDATVTQSLSCLKGYVNVHSNTYTTALLAYVFTLARDEENRSLLLQHLDSIKIQKDGFIHWNQKSTETSQSLSVEISSYVLLAKLGSSPTVEDLGYASSIVRWLTSQQNSYGGYTSTQDTVVALQALSHYSTLVFSPAGSSSVIVSSPSGQMTFEVNQNNKLVYQEEVLKDFTGKYSVEVKGSACASLQTTLFYNIPTPTENTTLSVTVQTDTYCTNPSGRSKLNLRLTSLFSGEQNSTNMVILEINLLSGFQVDPMSFQRLKGALLVDRVEQKEDRVLVYLESLPNNIPIFHNLELVQEIPVQDLKPAAVKIYDYYQPSDQAETNYNFDCQTAWSTAGVEFITNK